MLTNIKRTALAAVAVMLLLATACGSDTKVSQRERQYTPPAPLLDATVETRQSLDDLDQALFELHWGLHDQIRPERQNITAAELSPEQRLALAETTWYLKQDVGALDRNLALVEDRLDQIIHPDPGTGKGAGYASWQELHSVGDDLIVVPYRATFGQIRQAIGQARSFGVEVDPALARTLDQSEADMARLLQLLG